MSITLSALQQQRRDSAANWTANNPTLLNGELGYETDTGYWKVGDGSTAWTSLAYIDGTKISAYPLVNADIDAAAAIAGTKIDPDFGSQNTTTTGTSTAASFNPTSSTVPTNGFYLPGTNQVAISTNGTGRLFVASNGKVGIGTASPQQKLDITTATAAPDASIWTAANLTLRDSNSFAQNRGGSIIFEGKFNTVGSYSTYGFIRGGKRDTTDGGPTGNLLYGARGGDHIFVNNGSGLTDGTSERLRITSDGKLGLGTSSPGSLLHTSGARDYTGSTPSASAYDVNFQSGTAFVAIGQSNGTPTIQGHGAGTGYNLALCPNAGNVGIGTTSPGYTLDVAPGSAGDAIRLRGGSGGAGVLQFTDSTASAQWGTIATTSSSLDATHSSVVRFFTASSERARIDNSGNVGIGTTSPGGKLDIRVNNSPQKDIIAELTAGSPTFTYRNGSGSWFHAGKHPTDDAFIFSTGATTTTNEYARIDSTGRLLVGTSSDVSDDATNTSVQIVGNADGRYGKLLLARNDSIITEGNTVGIIEFKTNDGGTYQTCASITGAADLAHAADDKPGRLVFSTTADGASSPTERLRINSEGDFYFNNTNNPSLTQYGTWIAGGSDLGFIATSRNVGGGGNVLSVFGNAGQLRVRGDGDCENTNNSYTGISDVKLKENIVDAHSQWDDLKALQVRNYNFKAETGYNTHTQIGLVAQEVELVSPGLVGESIDEETGESTKSVNYSVLYMKAVKALQEAMERIETLEQRLNDAGIA